MNIVIVGGGTAGWVTALYAKKMYPNENITLIQSPEIGILGAGEGSTPRLLNLFSFLDISLEELIKKTKSTIKVGIKFSNWSKDKDNYFHNFLNSKMFFSDYLTHESVDFFKLPLLPYEKLLDIQNKSQSLVLNEILNNGNVPFSIDIAKNAENKMDKVLSYSFYSIHFDAKLLAIFLSEIGTSRGIQLIEDDVVKIKTNKNNDIVELILKNKKNILTDFVFDCSGFSRLIIGKHYNSKWKSFSEFLPMKKALPFFIEMDKDSIPAYTEAIAMDYGWMWKIPLQHRYGCGYVFDSDYIDEDQAKEEIEKFLGFKPFYPRETKGAFSFNPGCFEEVWINNCLAVGLSSAFVEPLEATSLGQTVDLLQKFFTSKHLIFSNNKTEKKLFNKNYLTTTEEIVDFLCLHYVTNKDNSEFWKHFNKKNKKSKKLTNYLKLGKNFNLKHSSFMGDEFFTLENYYEIIFGNKIFNKKHLTKIKKEYFETNNLNYFNDKILHKKNVAKNFISHKYFLKFMGGLND